MGIAQREAHDAEVRRREREAEAARRREQNERRLAELMKPRTNTQIRNRWGQLSDIQM